MHRNKLSKLLHDYKPSHTEERFKDEMMQFINSNSDCFERSNLNGHITASAWLLNHKLDHALLMHHMKLNKWLQLGGHCDGDSDVLHVAIKEASEESGLNNIVPISESIFDIDIHEIPEHKGVPKHLHYDIRFLLKVETDLELVGNCESKALKWVSRDKQDLPTHEQSVLRMYNRWLSLGL